MISLKFGYFFGVGRGNFSWASRMIFWNSCTGVFFIYWAWWPVKNYQPQLYDKRSENNMGMYCYFIHFLFNNFLLNLKSTFLVFPKHFSFCFYVQANRWYWEKNALKIVEQGIVLSILFYRAISVSIDTDSIIVSSIIFDILSKFYDLSTCKHLLTHLQFLALCPSV